MVNDKVRSSSVRKKLNIATYFTRAIMIVIGILTFGVLFQSYQFSSELIAREVKRINGQTSDFIQEILDFQLALIKTHQDSNATNSELLEAVIRHADTEIMQFFAAVDQLDPENTPDIRFISGLNEKMWDDGNAEFYGIAPSDLQRLSGQMNLNGSWRLVSIPSVLETIYAFARKIPLISIRNGEVIGYFYVLSVVNNNYVLSEHIRESSHLQDLIFAVGSDVLASTLNGTESYTEFDLLHAGDMSGLKDLYTVSQTTLSVNHVPTPLAVYAVNSNHNIVELKRNFYFSIIFIVVAMGMLSFVLWRWLNKSIRFEIDKLVQFIHSIVDKGVKHTFHGSKIEEFDLFGRALEHTFKRFSEQEKQFENLFNYSVSPTILWGMNGHLIRMNPAAFSHFSEAAHTSRFRSLKDLLLPEIEKILYTEKHQLDEITTEIEDRIFRWTISPIIHEGRVESVLTQGQDVTSIAEAERESHQARSEAERAANARADFLARMSHEVRTPLNGILGVAQLLKDNATDAKQSEQVGVLCLCSEHLLAVLNDILDFSKIEQNKFKISNVRFYLMDTIHVVDRIYRPLCEEKSVEFHISTNIHHNLVVCSDQVRLNQIIFNLLNNAVKFTHHGRISISLNLFSTASEDKEHFHVCVQDTGVGIKNDDISLIFEPFIQSETTSIREYGGSGLGLAIVKNLVELMNGTITVNSVLDEGSCFEFTIPIDVEHQPEHNHDENLLAGQSRLLFDKTLDVLLVEDNHTNAYIAKAFCDKFGLNVTWVEDGQKALDTVKRRPFDLILMDNQLPKMDGIEVTKRIREQLEMSVPVYACTADDSAETQQAFLDAGAQYVLVKPIREENLYSALVHFKEGLAAPETKTALR
ncbi:LuxQ periplasmic sensor domain-containing protein [Vibrio quintilis]|uniref:Autoinducer 2 sensor kinase/phosphatase LuxQ n=1 Tax=Vibrio quintilis TaxID=1117707 RepID=A0A1M7YS59_9VIBR|nr:LuxQ periplasmic sensor domain-containing protein [Vibrio quintilis]SHO55451.1 Autoinducer 2 sensor kinase/phosphatase LuxQ [Vibrio quintilis]